MNIVWERGRVTVRDVYEVMLQRRKIAYTTVMTTMKIMEEKGHLKKTAQGRAYVYSPAQPKSQVIRNLVTDFLGRVSSDGSRAYVTNRGAEGTLSVIFLDEEREPVVIHTGEGAEGLAVSLDDAEVWVANRLASTISIIDTGALEVVATIAAPPDSRRVEISPTERVLVPNGTQGGAIAQYDRATRELLLNAPIQEEGEGGSAGILSHGSSAFISDRSDNAILVYDLYEPGILTILATDHDAPDGMAWSPLRVASFR